MTGYDRAEYETWVAQTEASYGPMALLRARDAGKAEAVADLKDEGYRVVKLDPDGYYDRSDNWVDLGTYFIQEEL